MTIKRFSILCGSLQGKTKESSKTYIDSCNSMIALHSKVHSNHLFSRSLDWVYIIYVESKDRILVSKHCNCPGVTSADYLTLSTNIKVAQDIFTSVLDFIEWVNENSLTIGNIIPLTDYYTLENLSLINDKRLFPTREGMSYLTTRSDIKSRSALLKLSNSNLVHISEFNNICLKEFIEHYKDNIEDVEYFEDKDKNKYSIHSLISYSDKNIELDYLIPVLASSSIEPVFVMRNTSGNIEILTPSSIHTQLVEKILKSLDFVGIAKIHFYCYKNSNKEEDYILLGIEYVIGFGVSTSCFSVLEYRYRDSNSLLNYLSFILS